MAFQRHYPGTRVDILCGLAPQAVRPQLYKGCHRRGIPLGVARPRQPHLGLSQVPDESASVNPAKGVSAVSHTHSGIRVAKAPVALWNKPQKKK